MRLFNKCLALALLTLALGGATAFADVPEGAVNLNTATAAELQLLPRVGPALAGRILEFREQNGEFRSVDELVAVSGIGETSLDNMRDWLTVEGETSLDEKVRLPRPSKDEAPESAKE